MMALRLEIFDAQEVQADNAATDELRRAAFDEGYAAGLAAAAQDADADRRRIDEDLSANLQAMAFTWHEARVHVLMALEPLLTRMTATLLPKIAREALAPVVLEALMPMARDMADAPVTLAVHPEMRAAVDCGPFTILNDLSLTPGQARLVLGQSETVVDLDRATADITAAIRGFFDLTEKDRRHG